MRYFIGFLITIGLIILLIILLVGGGGNSNSKSKVDQTAKPLINYASTSTVVRMTVEGPTNSQQEHQSITITVGKDNVVYKRLSGYTGTNVVDSKTYDNNTNAYSTFLHALAQAGYNKGTTEKELQDDSGFCPTGDRYIFEVIQNGKDVQRFWASNCGGPKTYQGNRVLTTSLFEAQIPNYDSVIDAIPDYQF